MLSGADKPAEDLLNALLADLLTCSQVGTQRRRVLVQD